MPAHAVRHFISRIHGAVEEGLLYKDIDETPEICSILFFCQFINSVFEGDVILPVDGLPVRHVAFYRKMVMRLIGAGELPVAAGAKFDAVFSSGFLKSLTTCQPKSENVADYDMAKSLLHLN